MTGLQQRHMQSLEKDEHRRKSEKLKQGGERAEHDFGMGDDIGSALENAGVGYPFERPSLSIFWCTSCSSITAIFGHVGVRGQTNYARAEHRRTSCAYFRHRR